MLEISEDACRQRVHRAKQRLREDRPRQTMPNADIQRRLLERFMQALQQPDMPTLRALFAEDAMSVSDGGGLARATLHPLHGAERLARLYMQIALQQQRHGGVRHEIRQLNGTPALFGWQGDTLVSASWIDDDGERITAVHALRHPGKLARLAAVTKSTAPTSLH
jgi:RNA polymerase sigma-70 factor (ECF subfamily)